MNNNREEYYNCIRKLNKEGLVKEIFYDEYLSILNIADEFYMINFIEENDKKDSYITGLIANYEMIDYVSNGLEYYYQLLKTLGNKAKTMTLNENTIEKIRGFKANTMEQGPSKFINYKTEIMLIKKVNERKGRGR